MKLFEGTSLKRALVLVTTLLILTAALLTRTAAPVRNIPAQADPQTMYHLVWEVAGESFFDQQKLAEWKAWEHKYDGQLKTQEDAVKAVNEMLKSLGDPYTYFVDSKSAVVERDNQRGSFVGIGVVFGYTALRDGKVAVGPKHELLPVSTADGYPLVRQVIEGGPASAEGIKAGDAIVSVTDLSQANATTLDARTLSLKALSENIRGKANTKVRLVVLRDGQLIQVTIPRGPVALRSVTFERLPDNMGYIRIHSFGADNMLKQLVNAVDQLKGSKGIIIDLRNNPGGQVNNAILGASIFLERGRVVTTKTRESGGLVELEYVLTPDKVVVAALRGEHHQLQEFDRPIAHKTNVPLVILVNENSASASEMFTGALKDNGRAVVVGQRTVGKGIGQSVIPMPNGTLLHVTSLRYYTPSMRWVGDASRGMFSPGITPDVVVVSDRYSDGDQQMKAAVERLKALIARGN